MITQSTDNREANEVQPVTLSLIEKLPLTESAERVIQILTRERCRVLLAGGAVRDHLMGQLSKDIDLCTNALPEQLIEILERNNIKVLPIGQAFGIVIAVIDGEQIEIATFRTDGYSSDARRPDTVTLGVDPAEDAKRRDLTINGLFYDPVQGIVVDHVGGAQDIADRKLRFIGNPEERIAEDNLRMMRYVRFLLKTGFDRDPASEEAVINNSENISTVSAERIKDEMEKMLAYNPISQGLAYLSELKLLPHILPEAEVLLGREKIAADELPVNASNELKWAALVYEAGSKKVAKFCKRLKFSNVEKEKVVWLSENLEEVVKIPEMEEVQAKRFILNKDFSDINPYFEDLMLLAQAVGKTSYEIDEKKVFLAWERINLIKQEADERQKSGLQLKKLVTGKDVMEKLGIAKGGAQVGKLLNQVHDWLLVQKEPTREGGLRYLDGVLKG